MFQLRAFLEKIVSLPGKTAKGMLMSPARLDGSPLVPRVEDGETVG